MNKQNLNYTEIVREFHERFGHIIKPTPALDVQSRDLLRYNLLEEEVIELKEAIIKEDLVEVLDALVDIQYVLSGAILHFGLQNIFDQAFQEVHRSNMSKACETQQEALDTIEYYRERGIDSDYIPDEDLGVYFVLRKSDGKILKSINYSPANLKQFLEVKKEIVIETFDEFVFESPFETLNYLNSAMNRFMSVTDVNGDKHIIKVYKVEINSNVGFILFGWYCDISSDVEIRLDKKPYIRTINQKGEGSRGLRIIKTIKF